MKTFNKVFGLTIISLAVYALNNTAFSKDVIIKEEVKAKITIVEGDIFVVKNNNKIKAKKGTVINSKDKIITNNKSKVEITFPDKTKLRINQNSEVLLSPMSSKKEKYSFLKVLKGQIWANVINKGEGRFAIKAKNSVFAVMGTTFDVNNTSNNTEMSVFDGSVGVTANKDDNQLKEQIKELHLEIDDNKKSESNSLSVHQIEKPIQAVEGPKQVTMEEWIEITKNQKITIDDNGNSVVSEISKDNDWTKWNKDLDKKEGND